MLKPMPLIGLGNQGRSANVNAQSRTNLYAAIDPDPEKSSITLYPTPGIEVFVNFGVSPIRGMYTVGTTLYVVQNNTLYAVLNNGTYTNIGTLLTYSGIVRFADNGTQIIIVDGAYGYIYNMTTLAFAQITDADFPAADDVTFHNGRFVIVKPSSGQFYISTIYDGLNWGALDYVSAESAPDNIIRGLSEAGQLVFIGKDTAEFWGDSGALDFPYARIGSTTIEWGLAAKNSLCKFMDSLIFLRQNRLGSVQVCVQANSAALPVSTPEMDVQFGTYTSVSDAIGFAYMLNGFAFYQLNFPTQNVSWLYNGGSKSWSKLESSGNRHRAELFVNFLGKFYVSDYSNGKLYRLDKNVYTDDGAAIAREFTGRHQNSGNYSTIAKFWLDLEAGVGLQNGQGTDPQVMMQISKDGGHEWGQEQWRSMGAVGKYFHRATWTRLGRARDWLFRFRCTEPVKTVFIAGWVQRG